MTAPDPQPTGPKYRVEVWDKEGRKTVDFEREGQWDGSLTPQPAVAEFLLARLAEEARRVDEIPEWHCTDSARGEGWGNRGTACPLCDHYMFDGTESATKDAWWDHMEDVHRRTRVLADVAAKRQIVDSCSYLVRWNEALPGSVSTPGVTATDLAKQTLRILAQPYADHSDYQPEWRP